MGTKVLKIGQVCPGTISSLITVGRTYSRKFCTYIQNEKMEYFDASFFFFSSTFYFFPVEIKLRHRNRDEVI